MALEQKTEEGGSHCATHPNQPRRGPFDLTDRAGPSYNVADGPGNGRTRCRHRQFPAPSGGSEPVAQDRAHVHRRRARVRDALARPQHSPRATPHGRAGTRGRRPPGSRLAAMTTLNAFGALAVGAMLLFYTLESRSPWAVLAFAAACLASSGYGFLQGAWPFGVVELVWGGVAGRRWRSRSHATR